MTQASLPLQKPATVRLRNPAFAWLGMVPFFLFAIAFLFLPSSSLFVGSFQNSEGGFTFDNLLGLSQPKILD
ncbi:MAG: acriflavin resistance protein, partial [Chloroflexota bacterium]